MTPVYPEDNGPVVQNTDTLLSNAAKLVHDSFFVKKLRRLWQFVSKRFLHCADHCRSLPDHFPAPLDHFQDPASPVWVGSETLPGFVRSLQGSREPCLNFRRDCIGAGRSQQGAAQAPVRIRGALNRCSGVLFIVSWISSNPCCSSEGVHRDQVHRKLPRRSTCCVHRTVKVFTSY